MLTQKIGSVVAVVLGLMISAPYAADAAQVGKVIVDEASLREYPQANSKVLAKLKRDESVTVSNVATEGFYKARAKNGTIGWVSGNDIFVKGAGGRGKVSKRSGGSSSESYFKPEDTRVQLTYGFDSLSYSGMSSVLTTTGLNMGTGLGLEGQFRMNDSLFWAIRAEYHMANSGDVSTTNASATAVVQTIKTSLIPVMVGLNWTASQNSSLRFGFGLYAGLAVVSAATVTQTSVSAVDEVKYSSVDLCGTLTGQAEYAITDGLGILAELGYRYQKTGEFASTTRFGSISGFSINYSGITMRLGLGLKL